MIEIMIGKSLGEVNDKLIIGKSLEPSPSAKPVNLYTSSVPPLRAGRSIISKKRPAITKVGPDSIKSSMVSPVQEARGGKRKSIQPLLSDKASKKANLAKTSENHTGLFEVTVADVEEANLTQFRSAEATL